MCVITTTIAPEAIAKVPIRLQVRLFNPNIIVSTPGDNPRHITMGQVFFPYFLSIEYIGAPNRITGKNPIYSVEKNTIDAVPNGVSMACVEESNSYK